MSLLVNPLGRDMAHKNRPSSVRLQVVLAALTVASAFAAKAQSIEANARPSELTKDASPSAQVAEIANATKDVIADLPPLQSVGRESIPPNADTSQSAVAEQISRAFQTSKARPGPARTQSCLDYLMLESDERYRAELSRRARPNQFEGAHPCDPVLPPLYDSPLNTPYVEATFPPTEFAESAW
jgi:hypothetical protein